MAQAARRQALHAAVSKVEEICSDEDSEAETEVPAVSFCVGVCEHGV
jgi:hypothetical protein